MVTDTLSVGIHLLYRVNHTTYWNMLNTHESHTYTKTLIHTQRSNHIVGM